MNGRKRNFVRATATTALDTQATVGTGADWEVSQTDLCNTTGAARTITLMLGGKAIFSGFTIGPNQSVSWSAPSTGQMLHAGDTIQTQADANSAVDVSISGIEYNLGLL